MAIKTIAIVHHVHTDFGYTDHQNRCKREQVKYIHQAIDYVLKSNDYPEGARFAWTQEQLYQVREFWENASEEQKDRFWEALKTGRLEITGTPFNVTAFMSREEWETAMNWISPELWNKCNITTAMQIDVNGMHTPGMICAYEKGIRNLWMGPNSYYGVPPLPAPTAFNWQIDNDKKMFVWLNASYNNGTFLFNTNWRQGPVPGYADLRYRTTEAGDIWDCSEEAVRKSHVMCLENIALIEGTTAPNRTTETDGFTKNRLFGGYQLSVLPVSVTNQWRLDNDPPFYPLVDFVKKWNEMQLEPRLVLCTATQAMNMVKEELGDDIPTYTGQWIDWWANGTASTPRELSYVRQARRVLKSAVSEIFGDLSEEQKKEVRKISEDICVYYEHSWGSWQSVSNPYAFESISQAAEKNVYAYRALDSAKGLLAERARAVTKDVRNKIVVWNTSDRELSAPIELPLNCMRGKYHSVRCEETGDVFPVKYVDGIANFLRPKDASEFGPENVSRTFSDKCEKQGILFGPVVIPAKSKLHLIPMTAHVTEQKQEVYTISAELDHNGWPKKLWFEGQEIPVVSGSFGEFISVGADGFSPRWTMKDIFENDSEEERFALRKEHLIETEAVYGRTIANEENGLLTYEQTLEHPALHYGKRILKADLHTGKVQLEFHMNRRYSFEPEILFLCFEAPETSEIPTISNAGCSFRPELDQFPGSCQDFYAFEGWIHYPNGWLLNCVDNALVTFGETSVVERKQTMNGPANRMYIRLFDNIWDTNFEGNSCGVMHFSFQACTGVTVKEAANAADNLQTEPVIAVKMGYKES